MSTESDGRGLPVGWAWGDDAGPKGPGVESRYLYAPGATDYNAAAYNDGSWDAYAGECRTETVGGSMVPHDSPRSPDLLAAAQREAVAALWRAGVFGDVAEVDAVRAPVEPASLPCPDDFEPQHFGVDGSGQERMPPPLREPAPREPSAPAATRCSACKQVLACGCDARQEPTPSAPNLHDQIRARAFVAPTNCTCGANVSRWLVRDRVSRCNGCGAVTDHRAGPSAPTDAEELARLLPGLAEDIERVRSMLGREVSMARRMRLARACELLLAERERMARENAAAEERADEWARRLAEAIGTVKSLRARVAVLEAERTREPTGHRVAALLLAVEEARDAARDKSGAHSGESPMAYRYEGMRDAFDIAADIIRATLGAPSALDRALREWAASTRGKNGVVAFDLAATLALLDAVEAGGQPSAIDRAVAEPTEDQDDAPESFNPSDVVSDGERESVGAAMDLMRHPAPMLKAVAEVVAVDVADDDALAATDAQGALDTIDYVWASGAPRFDVPRDRLKYIAAVALAGMLADASSEKGGA